LPFLMSKNIFLLIRDIKYKKRGYFEKNMG
jgi:hypothetical protein